MKKKIFAGIFMILYLLFGLFGNINPFYLQVLLFLTLKIIFNLRICMCAAIECKIRNISKEESIINQILHSIIDLREEKCFAVLIILTSLYILYQNCYNILCIAVN